MMYMISPGKTRTSRRSPVQALYFSGGAQADEEHPRQAARDPIPCGV
jgi:hypothetical protein